MELQRNIGAAWLTLQDKLGRLWAELRARVCDAQLQVRCWISTGMDGVRQAIFRGRGAIRHLHETVMRQFSSAKAGLWFVSDVVQQAVVAACCRLGQAPAKTWAGLQRLSAEALQLLQQAQGTACHMFGNVRGCRRGVNGLKGGKLSRPLLSCEGGCGEGGCDQGITPQVQLGPSRQASRIWWPCARSARSATDETSSAGMLAQSATNSQALPRLKTSRAAGTWRWLFSARVAAAQQPDPHCSSFNGHNVSSSFQKKLWPRKHSEASSCRRSTWLGYIKAGRQAASCSPGHYLPHEVQRLGEELEAAGSLLGNESLDRADLEARLKRVPVAKLRRYLEQRDAPLPDANADQQQHVQAVIEAWELHRQRL